MNHSVIDRPEPDETDAEDAVRQAFRTQHGVISRAQAMDAGMTVARIRLHRESGRWEDLAPSVYGLAGHRPSWRRRLWAAQIHAGPYSAIAYESAGRLHRVEEVLAGVVALIVPLSSSRPPAGVRWYRQKDLDPVDVVVIDGLRVTSLPRTVVDLAGALHIARLRLVVEHGVVEKRFTLEQVGATLDRLRRQGKPGVTALTKVLDDLGPGDGIPRSKLERLLDEVIALAGLPTPTHEHPLPGHGGRKGFVDHCWPEAGLIAEADGRKWHTRRQHMLADHDRSLQAQAAGFDTSRLLWEHLAHDPDGTAVLLRSIYDQRRARAADGQLP